MGVCVLMQNAGVDGKEFPGELTKNQADTVLEAASWCANHMMKQGQD